MTKYIKAPFNFVPLNKKVVEYEEPENISHAIPFEKGESGSIDISITAKTPVFLRNGSAGKEEKASDFSHIFDHEGKRRYFIPGTSLKGMFRNVLEILSEGYLRVQKEMRFAVRDWNDQSIYPIKDPNVQNHIRCGWLSLKEKGYSVLYDHDIPYRINHLALDEYFHSLKVEISFTDEFSKPFGKRAEELPDNMKEATYKYDLIDKNNCSLNNLKFSHDDKYYREVIKKSPNTIPFAERRWKVDEKGDYSGTIVFTGQPNRWKNPQKEGPRGMNDGKFYEFIFPSERITEYKIPEETINQIKFIYQDSSAWKYFKRKGDIPVFFRTEKNAEGKLYVKDFGLALLYKLPYDYSAMELVKEGQNIDDLENLIDLADAVFGSTKGGKKSSLLPFKGRVQFGHAFASSDAQEDNEVIKRLGSPKASYLPIYIDQSGLLKNGETTKYKSYHDKDALLSGWKRYPVHYGANYSGPEDGLNQKLDIKFRPLKSGTEFKTKVRFHNLEPYEVGALLSAITFHGNENELCHSLGMAKSHGFGKISVKINLNGLKSNLAEYLEKFEHYIYKINGNSKWIQQSRIVELMTMAWDRKTQKDDLLLEYMKMDNDPNQNEFLSAKGGKTGKGIKEYLGKYTLVSKLNFSPNSYLEDYLKRLKDLEDKAEEAKIKEEREALEREIKEKEQALQEAIKNSQEKKAQEGLSVLNNHTDWSRAQKEIDKFLKLINASQVPDDQIEFLLNFLNRLIPSLKKRDLKEWENDFEKSRTWQKVSTYVNESLAREWYGKIMGK